MSFDDCSVEIWYWPTAVTKCVLRNLGNSGVTQNVCPTSIQLPKFQGFAFNRNLGNWTGYQKMRRVTNVHLDGQSLHL